MKERIIKPEFWGDRKMCRISRDIRLMYIGLWNCADDNGVFPADIAYIKSSIFPFDEITYDEICSWVKVLVDENVIEPLEYLGRKYYKILNFWKHQRVGRIKASDLFIPIAKVETKKVVPKNEEGVEENEDFVKFKGWLQSNAPNILKMQRPFTQQEFLKLKEEYGTEYMISMIKQMDNWRPLLQKCVSAYLTFRNWAKRDKEYERTRKASRTDNAGLQQGQSGISTDYAADIYRRLGSTKGNGSTA